MCTSKGYIPTIGCVQGNGITSDLSVKGSTFISASTFSSCAALPVAALALGSLADVGVGVVPVNADTGLIFIPTLCKSSCYVAGSSLETVPKIGIVSRIGGDLFFRHKKMPKLRYTRCFSQQSTISL